MIVNFLRVVFVHVCDFQKPFWFYLNGVSSLYHLWHQFGEEDVLGLSDHVVHPNTQSKNMRYECDVWSLILNEWDFLLLMDEHWNWKFDLGSSLVYDFGNFEWGDSDSQFGSERGVSLIYYLWGNTRLGQWCIPGLWKVVKTWFSPCQRRNPKKAKYSVYILDILCGVDWTKPIAFRKAVK